jgi:hypothetical protein
MEILTIKSQISPNSAKVKIKEKEKSIEVKNMESIFYPYLYIEACINTRVLSHIINDDISWMIDMINGAEALTEKVTENQKLKVDIAEDRILNVNLTVDEARKRAISSITHVILQRIKILQAPRILVLKEELLYKPFWLMECYYNNKKFHLLIDAVNGYYYPVFV